MKTSQTDNNSRGSAPSRAKGPAAPDLSGREYEKSGMYPENGRPFRLVALVMSLVGVMVFIALSAIVLDTLLM